MEKKTKKAIVKKESTDLIVPENQSVENLIKQAIEKGTPVETMEKLLAMRRELKAEWAKEQFDKAMANFQNECPTIKKTKPGGQTKSGVVAYYYAPLESIVEQVRDFITKNGFSYKTETETKEKGVKVTCIVKHLAGHSESSDVEVPLGSQTGVMSAPQVVASALTFAKRYAFCNAFGILTGDDDNDGASGTGPATKEDQQIKKFKEMVSRFTLRQCVEQKGMISKSDRTEERKNQLISIIVERENQLEK
jgi:hypothetical protein